MPRTPTGRPPGRPRKPAPEPAAAVAVLDEGPICRVCWPDGWPSGQVGGACSHGQWFKDESARPLTAEALAAGTAPSIGQVAHIIAAMSDAQLGELMAAVQELKAAPPAADIPGTDTSDPSLDL